MFGVTSEILDSEGASINGEDDFFSVANTIPLVAKDSVSYILLCTVQTKFTFDTQRSDTLVDSIESILNLYQLAAGRKGCERE